MGEKQERAEEPEQEPPRKSPRLDLQGPAAAAAVAAGSECGEAVAPPPEMSNLREERAEGGSDNKQCNHVPTGSAHVNMLRSSALSPRAGRCELCESPFLGADILVCLECGRHFCSGVGSVEYPFGHSRLHAQEENHWVAALSENPESAFCFKCDCVTDGPHGTIPGNLAAAAVDYGSSQASPPEPCNHFPTDNAHREMLRLSLMSEHAGMCVHCKTFNNILVCMECGRHLCVGFGSTDCPAGHSLLHAKQKQHWVAALYDEPESAYCFKCGYTVCVTDPSDDMEIDGYEAGDHAVKLSDEDRNICRGLSNALRESYVHDYAIRGMPNLGNTCYMNAVVQCFLVLDKLRERMLGPDAPKGLFAEALAELFVGASAAESLLNPEKFLACVRLYKKDFQEFGMQHDSHELLMSLLGALDEEEIKIRRHEQNGAPTVIQSIFGFKMNETRICKCLSSSVSHPDFLDLSLTLASQIQPAESAALRRTIENSKSKLEKVATQLFPANEQSKSERIQTVSKSDDSHQPCSDLEDVVMEEAPGPLDVDSSGMQRICQSEDVVQGPLWTQEDKVTCPELSERITEVPVKSASLLHLSMFDVKVKEMNETTADSVASIEDCLSLFLAELLEWRCDNCSKLFKELSTNQCKNDEQVVASMEETTTVHGDQGEQSDRTTCKNDQSSGSNSLPVESESSPSMEPRCSDAQLQNIQTEKVTGGTKLGQHSEDISIQIKMYQEMKKQIELDCSAYQLEDNRNEQKDWNGHAIQTRCFLKLPPVLTLHVRRTNINGLKITDHVRYKEYLDVEPFTDPSSEDKGNFMYRLVGVVEHRGTESVEKGHYVAYVRARKLGQGSCSHSWFCADDRTISEVSLEDVLKREAYILFYERMEG